MDFSIGASSDLMLMTQENQSFAYQLSTVVYEKEVLLAKITELNTVLLNLQQSLRASEIEKEDILQAYRNCIQDRKKLEQDCHLLG